MVDLSIAMLDMLVYQKVSLSLSLLSLFVLNVPSTKEQRSTLIHDADPAVAGCFFFFEIRSLESHHVASLITSHEVHITSYNLYQILVDKSPLNPNISQYIPYIG